MPICLFVCLLFVCLFNCVYCYLLSALYDPMKILLQFVFTKDVATNHTQDFILNLNMIDIS
jgi:hypothetical protein